MYKIMFSAGEASGDLHGARLAHALKGLSPDIRLTGLGGPKMAEAGVELCRDFRDYSVMGVWEVLKNLHRIFALRDTLLHFMEQERPDLLVIIDYPDFNWRLAKKARAMGIPVFSYIPPSAWAWRKGRAKSCAAIADELVSIFPFDLEVYRQAGANISFVGNPLVDIVKPSLTEEEARVYFGVSGNMRPVLLLPGSRKQEIEQLLPVMLASAEQLQREMPETEFFLPVAPGIDRNTMESMADCAGVKVHFTTEYTYDLMGICHFALATSGTVVMEAALMGLPCIVLYRMSGLSYFIGRLLVHIEYFSLPNILANAPVQPELLQDEVTVPRILEEARRLCKDEAHLDSVHRGLALACEKLGPPDAAGRTARLIFAAAERSRKKSGNSSGEINE